ncbi:MAG: alpha/beta fold hydrolase [Hyphomicrobiaceae bacterium]
MTEVKPLDADTTPVWRDLKMTTRDGIRLHARHYPAPGSTRRPVLCLAGLTRNSRDFHVIATALSGDGPEQREVFTLDSRGRGGSDYSSSWKDYAVPIEMLDVQDFMAAHQLHGTGILGTSRGGMITMVMAAAQPSLIGAVVLNDIGPVIEYEGLARIAGYVGKTPTPRTWPDAARQVEMANAPYFPSVSTEEWSAVARQFFNESNGSPAPGYDPLISRGFSLGDGPIPELWPQFLALKNVPCMVVRGSHSDLLGAETVRKMQERHPNCNAITVDGQGHAPLLRDTSTINAIKAFFLENDL